METVTETQPETPVDTAERIALERGWSDVRASFGRWNRDLDGVVRVWMGTSFTIGCVLLAATWAVSVTVEPGPPITAFDHVPSFDGALHLLRRNGLVLLMHALICVAGYMAVTSMPIVARGYTGWKRRLHLAAGPIAIGFVTVVTIGSFLLQAWSLGTSATSVALAYGIPTWKLLVLVSPHALIELTAMFLPLGAWLVLVRRGAYHELLAASVLAFAVALPMLVIAAIIEEWVSPVIFLRFA